MIHTAVILMRIDRTRGRLFICKFFCNVSTHHSNSNTTSASSMGNQSTSQSWPPSWVKVKSEGVPTVDGKTINKSDFQNSLQRSDRAPKIFKSVVDATALAAWNPDNLVKVLGGASVEVYVSTSGNFPGGHGSIYDNKERKKVVMKAKEALERINHVGNHQPVLASGERYYIYQYDSKPFAPLIDQIPNSPSHLVSETVFTNVWISAADSLTPAHYDKADNLLLQVKGSKSFLIWDPAQLPYLSLQPETADQDRQTTINMRDQHSVEAHPNFRNASAYHCILTPGDVLYMPEGWIHAVYSMDPCASVNFWWNQPTGSTNEVAMEINLSMPDFDEERLRDTKVAPIPIPSGVVLAKKFDNRENVMRFDYGDQSGVAIACQACSSKQHDYAKCPYLGHYKYRRISGQSCDYNQYELVGQQQEAPLPLIMMPIGFGAPSENDFTPVDKPALALPTGLKLTKEFRSGPFMQKEKPCQACNAPDHAFDGCPYLGHYKYATISGQISNYELYTLK